MPAEGLQNLGFTPKLTLIDSYANGSLDIGFAMKFNIMSLDEFKSQPGDVDDIYGRYVSNHLIETSVTFKAREKINIGIQLKIILTHGLELFRPFWLVPLPKPIGCVVVYVQGDIPQLVPLGQKFDDKTWNDAKNGKGTDKSGNAKAWKAMGDKSLMKNWMGIWIKIGATGAVDFTTPGFDLRIPQGAIGEIGQNDGKTFHKHLDSSVS
ncbi:hypothetical protein CC86DRAFT_411022 [Ophiobolus disseminans]|uniref:Uncharacterized protein n=1 Tax=Ophiobolus disseminans TaxID=1469910 RepID=A0A6A6ZLW4_9PLEO|nr:hypothetical protein CC86DRAFT_411022 [Ophiobolus disseminans]